MPAQRGREQKTEAPWAGLLRSLLGIGALALVIGMIALAVAGSCLQTLLEDQSARTSRIHIHHVYYGWLEYLLLTLLAAVMGWLAARARGRLLGAVTTLLGCGIAGTVLGVANQPLAPLSSPEMAAGLAAGALTGAIVSVAICYATPSRKETLRSQYFLRNLLLLAIGIAVLSGAVALVRQRHAWRWLRIDREVHELRRNAGEFGPREAEDK